MQALFIRFVGTLLFLMPCSFFANAQKDSVPDLSDLRLELRQQMILPSSKVPSIKQGYFCRLEERNDKRSNIALRFRLGTQEVVDRMEGKRALPEHLP